jgi:hypothetical protein
MDLCNSFSIVNFIDGCDLLNLLSVCSVFILFWSYIISSTYYTLDKHMEL